MRSPAAAMTVVECVGERLGQPDVLIEQMGGGAARRRWRVGLATTR
jgi:hypothetical protein